MPPTSVNFTALESMLLMTWRSRRGSPTCAGARRSSTFQVSSRPFVEAVCTNVSTEEPTTARTSIVAGLSSSLSASIFDRSRMSPTICSSDRAEPSAVATIWRCEGLSSLRASTSSMPVTPIIGVRSSWLIAARNVDFARLACSAASRATTASCSARSRAAMSDSIAAAISLNEPATRSRSDTERMSTRWA